MDVSARIAQWKGRSPAQWIGLANRVLPPIATAVLVLAIAYALADLTVDALPGRAPDAPPPAVAAAAGTPAAAAERDYSGLRSAHLFGEAPARERAAPVTREVDAPDTTLNLQLTGIVEISEITSAQAAQRAADSGIAIIASGRGDEKAYAIGDTIEGADRARLHAVYGDRVLLDRAGQLETLRLPREASGRSLAAARPAPAPPPAQQESLREVINENATRITEIMRLAPHIEGGRMVGFRVNPGRDREAFEALGLQPGDIVTDVNGMVVDDPGRALQVYEALGESTMANVTVLRDGSPQVIVIDTSQLENLAENRQ